MGITPVDNEARRLRPDTSTFPQDLGPDPIRRPAQPGVTRVTHIALAKRYSLRHDERMAINYKVSDHVIDAIGEFIKDVVSELNLAERFYVLDGLSDVISNQRYDLEQEVTA